MLIQVFSFLKVCVHSFGTLCLSYWFSFSGETLLVQGLAVKCGAWEGIKMWTTMQFTGHTGNQATSGRTWVRQHLGGHWKIRSKRKGEVTAKEGATGWRSNPEERWPGGRASTGPAVGQLVGQGWLQWPCGWDWNQMVVADCHQWIRSEKVGKLGNGREEKNNITAQKGRCGGRGRCFLEQRRYLYGEGKNKGRWQGLGSQVPGPAHPRARAQDHRGRDELWSEVITSLSKKSKCGCKRLVLTWMALGSLASMLFILYFFRQRRGEIAIENLYQVMSVSSTSGIL